MSNIGQAAAAEIDSQIAAFRTLQEELQQDNVNLGTLMAQRNENEMVLKELEVCQVEEGEGNESVVYKQVCLPRLIFDYYFAFLFWIQWVPQPRFCITLTEFFHCL